jgi:hypothetical protein
VVLDLREEDLRFIVGSSTKGDDADFFTSLRMHYGDRNASE